jgi:hypothetical protein
MRCQRFCFSRVLYQYINALKLDADKAHDGKFHNYLYARGRVAGT